MTKLQLTIVKYTKIIILLLVLVYMFFAGSVSQEEAQTIALRVLSERYSKTCWWGFEENLTMKKTDSWDYDFLSENDRCHLYIFIHKYWRAESGVMSKD
jgi:hypothetical protein